MSRRRPIGSCCAGAARWWRTLIVSVAAAVLLQACSAPARLAPEPIDQTTKANVIDIPNARFQPTEQVNEIIEEGIRATEREMKFLGITDRRKLPPAYFLAISGGGADGAFGAGLLKAWTETGTRPEFKVVTGVSTGALAAPFAFLGSDYDYKIGQIYTGVSSKDIFIKRGLLQGIFDDALLDTAPLFALISRYLDEEMLANIAREYIKGRLLLIGTTNLDARRGVIWNIGAIAASGHPGALDLVHKILLASAAVPAAFPPVMIDVEVDGKSYQEMHVDGGTMAQLFLYPAQVEGKISAAGFERERRAYIIRNVKLAPDWANTERSTLDIAGRAISTLIHVSGLNDLYRVYSRAQQDGVDFNLAYIGSDFDAPPPKEMFDPVYMEALYNYGYRVGKRPDHWQKTPPVGF